MSKPLMAKPSTISAEARQRRIVRSRDKVCQFEKRGPSGLWFPCGKKSASDTAHLIRRPHLSPASRFHEDVAILACRDCHSKFDSYTGEVRAPIERARRAWNVACELSKVPPPARYNPDAQS